MTPECISCPRDECEGAVAVALEWEPADPSYGADADGNRGVYVRGYWSASVAGNACSLGHVLHAAEVAEIEKDAADNAPSDDEDEYYGPDGPDDGY